MTAHHELLQGTPSQDRSVMRSIRARSPYVSRGKQNFRSRFLRDVIADHRGETVRTADLAKVDLLQCSHALRKCGLFENVETTTMAIYTRLGAPVKIVEAEVRRRWWIMKRGRTWTFDKKPTDKQLKGAKEVDEFDIWWIKAKQIGAYPDGTGIESIGKFLSAPEDVTQRGFLDETFFRADDGIREIYAECEMVRDDAARAA